MPDAETIVAAVRSRLGVDGMTALAEHDVVASVPTGLWIGGEWRETRTRRWRSRILPPARC